MPVRKLWISLLLLACAVMAQPANVKTLNKGREGQLFNVTEYLTRGKINLVCFTSADCPSCQALEPRLIALAERDSQIVLNQMVIDRPSSAGIDWQSPLARQYELRSIPHFQVYDGSGNMLAEGEPARKMVSKMLVEAGVLD